MRGTDGRTSWLSQSLHALLPHPLPWQLVDGGSHKKVFTQATSHTKNLLFDQGTMATPSGQFPSALYKPHGSSLLGMFADANERCMDDIV